MFVCLYVCLCLFVYICLHVPLSASFSPISGLLFLRSVQSSIWIQVWVCQCFTCSGGQVVIVYNMQRLQLLSSISFLVIDAGKPFNTLLCILFIFIQVNDEYDLSRAMHRLLRRYLITQTETSKRWNIAQVKYNTGEISLRWTVAQLKFHTGVRRNRVVTFTAIRLRGPGFKPRPWQKFENENFSFNRTPAVVKACHACRVRP